MKIINLNSLNAKAKNNRVSAKVKSAQKRIDEHTSLMTAIRAHRDLPAVDLRKKVA